MKTNLIGISGQKQSGKNTVAKVWQALDIYYNKTSDVCKSFEDIDYAKIVLKYHVVKSTASSWKQKSFAHKLKQILCILTGCTMEQLEDESIKSLSFQELCDKGIITSTWIQEGLNGNMKISKKTTLRQLLQYIGTDLFKDKFHPSTWINGLFSEYKEFDTWLVTDVRFQDEADAITSRGGKLIKVERFKIDDKVYLQDESELDEKFNSSGKYEIVKIESDESCLLSNGTSEVGAWFHELTPIVKGHKSEIEVKNIQTNYTIYNCTTIENLIEQVKEIMIKEKVICI